MKRKKKEERKKKERKEAKKEGRKEEHSNLHFRKFLDMDHNTTKQSITSQDKCSLSNSSLTHNLPCPR